MQVQPFTNQFYPFGIRIVHTLENRCLHFNARSDDDRAKFVDDLRESIIESDAMEALRIEQELEKQRCCCLLGTATSKRVLQTAAGGGENPRDSGLGDVDVAPKSTPAADGPAAAAAAAVAVGHEDDRRSSMNSLDSGMSSNASTGSRESSPVVANAPTSVANAKPKLVRAAPLMDPARLQVPPGTSEV